MHDAAVGFQCPECVREGRASTRRSLTPFGAAVPRAAGATSAALVTYVLIALNVAFFLATAAGGAGLGFGGRSGPLFDRLALSAGPVGSFSSAGELQSVSAGVAGGAYYRLLTACFLHFGLFHLLANMYGLLLLGTALEPLFGRWRFLTVYLLSGLGGSVATYLFASNSFSAGASGAVFGLFAAYFLAARRVGADTRGILIMVGINLAITFGVPQISKTGHLGGLAVGLLAAAVVVYAPAGPGGSRRRATLQVVGLAVVAVLLVVATAARTAALR